MAKKASRPPKFTRRSGPFLIGGGAIARWAGASNLLPSMERARGRSAATSVTLVFLSAC